MNSKQKNNQVNLVDILFYLLRNWYWFAICAGLAVGYAYYKYTQMPFVYRSDVRVIIKDPRSTASGSSLANYSQLVNRVNMTNEILQLRSKTLMSEVVKALDADVNYTFRERLRDVELYHRTPTVQLVKGTETSNVTLGDTVSVDGHKLVFKPTSAYSPYYFGKEISITKVPVLSAANRYISRLSVTQGNGAILNLFVQDYNAQRATDILNTLIEEYNEDAIREKNRVAVNTAEFINERLISIQEELGNVESSLAQFKSAIPKPAGYDEHQQRRQRVSEPEPEFQQ